LKEEINESSNLKKKRRRKEIAGDVKPASIEERGRNLYKNGA